MGNKKYDIFIDSIKNPNYSDFFKKIYPFTTENIDAYIDMFDLKDKSLLTVGSSSDQVLNACFLGCNDITLIDINPYVKEYFYLKKACIETLSYKEFFKFLNKNSALLIDKSFSKKTFDKVLSNMDDYDSFEFWRDIKENISNTAIKNKLFSSDTTTDYKLKKMNRYLKNEKNYNEMKSKIKNLNPVFENFSIYEHKLNKNYDNIFLSNIADYNLVDDTKMLYERLKSNLNENGKMLVTYLYQTNSNTPYQEEYCNIYNLDNTKRLFNDTELIEVRGVKDLFFETGLHNDSILVYKKK